MDYLKWVISHSSVFTLARQERETRTEVHLTSKIYLGSFAEATSILHSIFISLLLGLNIFLDSTNNYAFNSKGSAVCQVTFATTDKTKGLGIFPCDALII
jgi:hypothetical protein